MNERYLEETTTRRSTASKINWTLASGLCLSIAGFIWQGSAVNSQIQQQGRDIAQLRADTTSVVANVRDDFSRNVLSLRTDMTERVNNSVATNNERLNALALDFTRRFSSNDTVLETVRGQIVEAQREIAIGKERLASESMSRRDAHGRLDQQIERLISSLNLIREQLASIARMMPRSPATNLPQQQGNFEQDYDLADDILMAMISDLEQTARQSREAYNEHNLPDRPRVVDDSGSSRTRRWIGSRLADGAGAP